MHTAHVVDVRRQRQRLEPRVLPLLCATGIEGVEDDDRRRLGGGGEVEIHLLIADAGIDEGAPAERPRLLDAQVAVQLTTAIPALGQVVVADAKILQALTIEGIGHADRLILCQRVVDDAVGVDELARRFQSQRL